jgi:hypothetical protein
MNRDFENRLRQYLNAVCVDFGMSYVYEWNQDIECCQVEIKREGKIKYLSFKHDEKFNDVMIELCEYSFHTTREFDYTVKYFWILVSPRLFPDI